MTRLLERLEDRSSEETCSVITSQRFAVADHPGQGIAPEAPVTSVLTMFDSVEEEDEKSAREILDRRWKCGCYGLQYSCASFQ